MLIRLYQQKEADDSVVDTINDCVSGSDDIRLESVQLEYCYYIDTNSGKP